MVDTPKRPPAPQPERKPGKIDEQRSYGRPPSRPTEPQPKPGTPSKK